MTTTKTIDLTTIRLGGISLVGVAEGQDVKVLRPIESHARRLGPTRFGDWREADEYLCRTAEWVSRDSLQRPMVVIWPLNRCDQFMWSSTASHMANLVLRVTSSGSLVVDKYRWGNEYQLVRSLVWKD